MLSSLPYDKPRQVSQRMSESERNSNSYSPLMSLQEVSYGGLVFDQDLTEEEAVRRSQELQIINAVGDSTGFCIFLGPTLEETASYLSPFFGEDISAQQLADIGWQCLTDEWQFNNAAGFTDKDDTCPSCLREEGIGPGQSMVFDISDKAIAGVKTRQPPRDELYNTSPAG